MWMPTGQTFKCRTSLYKHLRFHSGHIFQCKYCDKRFAEQSTLKVHLMGQSTGEPWWLSGLTYGLSCRGSWVQAPARTSVFRNSCAESHLKFATSFTVKENIVRKPAQQTCEAIQRTHSLSNARPFDCSLCERRFSQKAALRKHERAMHAPERPVLCCKQCDSTFLYKISLNKHILRHHSSTRCNLCDSEFSVVFHRPQVDYLALHYFVLWGPLDVITRLIKSFSPARYVEIKPEDFHCWTNASPLERHNERQLATCIHRFPATLTMSSVHLVGGLPTLRLPMVERHEDLFEASSSQLVGSIPLALRCPLSTSLSPDADRRAFVYFEPFLNKRQLWPIISIGGLGMFVTLLLLVHWRDFWEGTGVAGCSRPWLTSSRSVVVSASAVASIGRRPIAKPLVSWCSREDKVRAFTNALEGGLDLPLDDGADQQEQYHRQDHGPAVPPFHSNDGENAWESANALQLMHRASAMRRFSIYKVPNLILALRWQLPRHARLAHVGKVRTDGKTERLIPILWNMRGTTSVSVHRDDAKGRACLIFANNVCHFTVPTSERRPDCCYVTVTTSYKKCLLGIPMLTFSFSHIFTSILVDARSGIENAFKREDWFMLIPDPVRHAYCKFQGQILGKPGFRALGAKSMLSKLGFMDVKLVVCVHVHRFLYSAEWERGEHAAVSPRLCRQRAGSAPPRWRGPCMTVRRTCGLIGASTGRHRAYNRGGTAACFPRARRVPATFPLRRETAGKNFMRTNNQAPDQLQD
ncbi:hypothetical protein MSG28_007156 [Choristoneura fumiferana]|uniref:Uncharacterized protein n=1 Tax=Choristoneura fumiferana TaxID=7141 RepID=A0ACC0JML3_CHOFU|nr:hypothetical protein MSG28_007156 [Choristoneura fumiferana]